MIHVLPSIRLRLTACVGALLLMMGVFASSASASPLPNGRYELYYTYCGGGVAHFVYGYEQDMLVDLTNGLRRMASGASDYRYIDIFEDNQDAVQVFYSINANPRPCGSPMTADDYIVGNTPNPYYDSPLNTAYTFTLTYCGGSQVVTKYNNGQAYTEPYVNALLYWVRNIPRQYMGLSGAYTIRWDEYRSGLTPPEYNVTEVTAYGNC